MFTKGGTFVYAFWGCNDMKIFHHDYCDQNITIITIIIYNWIEFYFEKNKSKEFLNDLGFSNT